MVDKNNSQWFAFDGLNVNYLLGQYDRYLDDASQVDETLVPIFKVWDGMEGVAEAEMAQAQDGQQTQAAQQQQAATGAPLSQDDKLAVAKLTVGAFRLLQNIRENGHLQADIYPIKDRDHDERFDLAYYNLTQEDLAQVPGTALNANAGDKTADDYIQEISDLYTGKIGYDVAHLNPEEQNWFYELIEGGFVPQELDNLDRKKVIEEIFRAEGLEQYLQKYYMGQKRFSGEGLESLMPLMNRIVELAALEGVDNIYISMAHRGRLNGLVHVLDQSYEWLLAKFEGVPYDTGEESDYDRYNSTGDVKYHLGAKTTRNYDGNEINITMANNPSHLEFVNSVIQGMARADQDDRNNPGYSKHDPNKAMPILVHGDAAMVGQGVNYETFNLSNLNAYTTGGSIHIIANNLIGFTTYNEEQLSTGYSSDPSKGFGLPVIHVNADSPEDVVAVAKLAFLYRQRFHKDIVINLIGYRRLGHNELDEPRMTNPLMYQRIDALGTITEVYSDYLTSNNLATAEELKQVKADIEAELDVARTNVREQVKEAPEAKSLTEMIDDKIVDLPEVDTTVDKETLQRLNKELITWADDFNIISNLSRSLERRRNIFADGTLIDWSLAEALAFATILEDGNPIRLTGEDSERGTFSHRSMVMKDTQSGDNFTPMHHISEGEVSFDIYNSSLSEMAVLGFEYGYSMTAHDTLVFWEAQFGDFANGGQVITDQFISGGRKKWGELSGLTLLLPHGYEGAGPEHSSGRIERFLQLSAENSWTVVNLSTAAQLFHLLRRQAAALGTENIRPLVIFTPKSLLRSEDAASPIEDFTDGKFHPVLGDFRKDLKKDKVERIVLTSGRLSVDIAKGLKDSKNADEIAHIRVEELYPFPEEALAEFYNQFPELEEIVWVQEEPKNMGSYAYIHLNSLPIIPKDVEFKYIGRPAMSAPSEGLPAVHKREQERIVNEAINY